MSFLRLLSSLGDWIAGHATVLSAVVSAIAATVIGWFTIILTRVGNRQLGELKRSVEAAVTIELPIFVIEEVFISKTDNPYVIRFGNHGRTPAIIKANCLVLKLAKNLPAEPHYPTSDIEEIVQDRIVGRGTNYEISCKPIINEAEWEKIANAETVLWAYGFIDYLDFLKREHREGFCICFEALHFTTPNNRYPAGFPEGEPRWFRSEATAYTYNKTKEQNDKRN